MRLRYGEEIKFGGSARQKVRYVDCSASTITPQVLRRSNVPVSYSCMRAADGSAFQQIFMTTHDLTKNPHEDDPDTVGCYRNDVTIQIREYRQIAFFDRYFDNTLVWLNTEAAQFHDPGNPLLVDHMAGCLEFSRSASIVIAWKFIPDAANQIDKSRIIQAGLGSD
jgi:hypothetical protein